MCVTQNRQAFAREPPILTIMGNFRFYLLRFAALSFYLPEKYRPRITRYSGEKESGVCVLIPSSSASATHQIQPMAWGIHYRQRGAAGYRYLSVFAIAIKEACELLGQGADVSEVSNSDGSKTIGADEIRRICAGEHARSPDVITRNANPNRATRPMSVACL